MSDQNPIAANDSDGATAATATDELGGVSTLLSAIEAALAVADRLELRMIAIHLDHARELCRSEIAERGATP